MIADPIRGGTMLALCVAAGTSACATLEPAVYPHYRSTEDVRSSILIRDDGASVAVGTSDGDWHAADGQSHDGVRCAYLGGLSPCRVYAPVDGQERGFEGGVLRSERDPARPDGWIFLWRGPNDDWCSYARWAPATGVDEFGLTRCQSFAPRNTWVLDGTRGSFAD